ncbi:hypothetical protein EC957_009808 [Mortierella hygrophila]|uniref:CCHC-type domain-containing protein n=1 Tax=Mortierella hygrophila TaxID=979708 RepID=A0A9P6EV82_9FUNG|nr:hypothetical protein EC957_009808 [Mortierella hygrophila]
MLNLAKHPPFHPDPGEDDKMKVDTDPCESSSIILNDEEVAFGEKHGVFPEHTEFITVTRTRVPHTLRFPVSYFKEESKNMAYMCKWVTSALAEVAPVKPGSFTTALLLPPKENSDDVPSQVDDVPPPVEYLLFNVSSATDVAAACKHGGQLNVDNGQQPRRIYFEEHTATAQAVEKERQIKIGSLAWNTTNTNVRAALKDYGEIQSITTTFNSKMTMKEALVIFHSATSVAQLKEECATCLAVQDDVGTITRLGTTNISYDPTLTVKLAGLPRGTTPADLKTVFDCEIKTPNAVRSYHTITIPLSLTTKTRQPEAYVKFSTVEQQKYALRTKITLDGKETIWLNTNERTCFFCGRPGHFQRECDDFRAMLTHKATRRANAAIIRGTASSSRSTTHSSPHYPLTQVPIPTATPSIPSKQSPQRTTTITSQSRSYASAVSSPQKTKGSAASNPISISSTPPTARPSFVPRPQAAHSTSAVPAMASTDWTAYFNSQLAKMNQQHSADLASVRTDMATLNTKLDLLLNGMGVVQTGATTSFKTTVAEESEDVEITDATDYNIIAPDSIPSTPQSVPPAFQQHDVPAAQAHCDTHTRPSTPSTGNSSYYMCTLRPHSVGGNSKAKGDKERDESGGNRKLPIAQETGPHKDPKGKTPLRNQQQQAHTEHLDASTTENTPMTQIQLEQLVAVLMEENKEMKAKIQSMSEQFQAREGAYKALQDRLDQQQTGDRTVIAHGEELQYATMTSSECANYTGAPEIGSLGPTPSYTPSSNLNANNNNGQDLDSNKEI